METSVSVYKPITKESLLVTFAICQVLFYVDEGFYNADWMQNWGNWFVFALYMIIIGASTILSDFLFFHKTPKFFRVLMSSVTGTAVGLTFLFWLLKS